MSGQGEAVLSFTINIDAKLSAEAKQTLDDLKNAKMQSTATKKPSGNTLTPEEEAAGIVSKGSMGNFRKDPFFKEPEEEEKIKSHVAEALNKLDSVALQNLAQLASNPTSKIGNEIMKILGMSGPEGAAIAAAIAIAISMPEIIKLIVEALSKKGLPLNRDWHRYIDKEIGVGLTRELQKRKELGIDKVILSQMGNKFVPNNAHWTYDSYLNIVPSRIARIGLTDRAAGVITH